MEKKGIKSLADLIYSPEDDLFLSKPAAISMAEKFYKKLGEEAAEKFTSFFKSNEDEIKEMFKKYLNLFSSSDLFNAMMYEKGMQRLIYRNLSMIEKDLRENSYNLKKVYKQVEKRIKKSYSDF